MSKQTDSESSKNIDPARGDAPSGVNGRATTDMSTILGERPAPAAAEGEYMYCSLHRTLNADFPPP